MDGFGNRHKYALLRLLLSVILFAQQIFGKGFSISGNKFTMGGKPLRILAGNFHYFRSPEENWGQNLDRMLALGLNAVEFYIPWNYHETYKNTYNDLYNTYAKHMTTDKHHRNTCKHYNTSYEIHRLLSV